MRPRRCQEIQALRHDGIDCERAAASDCFNTSGIEKSERKRRPCRSLCSAAVLASERGTLTARNLNSGIFRKDLGDTHCNSQAGLDQTAISKLEFWELGELASR